MENFSCDLHAYIYLSLHALYFTIAIFSVLNKESLEQSVLQMADKIVFKLLASHCKFNKVAKFGFTELLYFIKILRGPGNRFVVCCFSRS